MAQQLSSHTLQMLTQSSRKQWLVQDFEIRTILLLGTRLFIYYDASKIQPKIIRLIISKKDFKIVFTIIKNKQKTHI